MKKIFIIAIMLISSLCVNHFTGESEVTYNANEDITEESQKIIADVEIEEQKNDELEIEDPEVQEIEQVIPETKTVEKNESTKNTENQKSQIKSSSSNTNNNKAKETTTAETKKEQVNNSQTASTNTQKKEEKKTNESNNIPKCTHTGNWYNTKAEAISVYDAEINKWGDKWTNYEIDNETYYKNCPKGYEVLSCPICNKWTINLFY